MQVLILVVSNLVTLLVGIILGRYGTTLFLVILNTTEEENPMTDTSRPLKKRRRFGRQDIIIAILIVGFIIAAASSISSNVMSANANRVSGQTVDRLEVQARCLTAYSNDLADALDRRTLDNQELQKADSSRDAAVDALLAQLLRDPPATEDEIRAALVKLRLTNDDKQRAKRTLDEGRQEKSYPQAPRDVCRS